MPNFMNRELKNGTKPGKGSKRAETRRCAHEPRSGARLPPLSTSGEARRLPRTPAVGALRQKSNVQKLIHKGRNSIAGGAPSGGIAGTRRSRTRSRESSRGETDEARPWLLSLASWPSWRPVILRSRRQESGGQRGT